MNEYVTHRQSEQDYLESILMLSREKQFVHRIDVAKREGVSQAAVNKAIKLLLEKGYVYEDGKHLYLTSEGEAYATQVYEKHCLVRDFLQKLGVSASTAEVDACKFEHLVSAETVTAMQRFLKEKV